jgi:hypothetical protein
MDVGKFMILAAVDLDPDLQQSLHRDSITALRAAAFDPLEFFGRLT